MYIKRYLADNFFSNSSFAYVGFSLSVDVDIVVMTSSAQVWPFGVYNAMKILQEAIRGVANKMQDVTLKNGLGKLKQ